MPYPPIIPSLSFYLQATPDAPRRAERIDDVENGKSYVISKDGKPGPVCTKLYNKLRAIQYGDEPDTHGWVTIVE